MDPGTDQKSCELSQLRRQAPKCPVSALSAPATVDWTVGNSCFTAEPSIGEREGVIGLCDFWRIEAPTRSELKEVRGEQTNEYGTVVYQQSITVV
jgi:hypothetical protein